MYVNDDSFVIYELLHEHLHHQLNFLYIKIKYYKFHIQFLHTEYQVFLKVHYSLMLEENLWYFLLILNQLLRNIQDPKIKSKILIEIFV